MRLRNTEKLLIGITALLCISLLLYYIISKHTAPPVTISPETSQTAEAMQVGGDADKQQRKNKQSQTAPSASDTDSSAATPEVIETEMVPAESTPGSDPVQSGLTVDINLATVDELTALPGIGQTLAERIVAYRDTNGAFSSIYTLKEVQGIGDATFEKIKPFITVS